ncbi:MAG: hypothetical protein QQN44_01815 [Nitrosopumilus sp.]
MMEKIHIAIISHKRPENVEKMEDIIGIPENLNWYVGQNEKKTYKHAQGSVIEVGNLCESRNKAIQIANSEDKYCLQLSDDLKECGMVTASGQLSTPNFTEIIKEMYNILSATPLYLAGVAPTGNLFFYNQLKPIGLKHFILGDLMLIKRNKLRFDEKLSLKEDYDYTLQHIKTYGGVVRLNYILPNFKHRVNKGGAVDRRTDEREQEAIEYLKNKWGSSIRDNPRRKNEILLKIK